MRTFALLVSILLVAGLAHAQSPTEVFTHLGTASNENMGHALAGLGGDVNFDGIDDYLVSALGSAGSGAFSGRVDVISGADGTVIRSHDGSAPYDHFGKSVAAVGDMDLDTFPDYAVGAPGAGPAGGQVTVFSGLTGFVIWSVQGVSSGPVGTFGESVQGLGDVDLDNYPDFAVAAPFEQVSTGDNGRIYVFSGRTGAEMYSIYNNTGHTLQGVSLAGGGDWNNDGTPDIATGTCDSNTWPCFANSHPHKVAIYSGNNGAFITEFTGALGFGRALAFVGDLDTDGHDELLVGAPAHDNGKGWAGVYSPGAGSYLYQYTGTSGAQLGAAVAGGCDINGDNVPDFLIGAPVEDTVNNTNSGAVHVHDGNTGLELHLIPGATASDQFGVSVACIGDVTCDGVDDFAVGAPACSLYHPQGGAASVFMATAPITASVQTIGQGCGGPGPVTPILTATAPVLGATSSVTVFVGIPNAPVFIFTSPPGAPVSTFFGCDVYLDITQLQQLLSLQTNASGAANMHVPVPNIPCLAGFTFLAQACFDVPGQMIFTNALQIQLGF